MFDEIPVQNKIPNEICFSSTEEKLVDLEVAQLLNEGVIVPSQYESGQYVSNIFLVSKTNGKFRPVINLKQLNKHVHYEHFKQETFPFVLELIQKCDFLTSLDLKSAYFSIPIDKDSQKYLKFHWRGQLYKFLCLAFGLSSAPFCFTKTLKPVYGFFRQNGIRCSYYIDDSINMNSDFDLCAASAGFMVEKLGIRICNQQRQISCSSYTETQILWVYFGYSTV
ncbi:MAG: reverse transcriptase domain-containing protein [Sedimenticola sp.]